MNLPHELHGDCLLARRAAGRSNAQTPVGKGTVVTSAEPDGNMQAADMVARHTFADDMPAGRRLIPREPVQRAAVVAAVGAVLVIVANLHEKAARDLIVVHAGCDEKHTRGSKVDEPSFDRRKP